MTKDEKQAERVYRIELTAKDHTIKRLEEEKAELENRLNFELPPPLPKKDYTRCKKCGFELHLPHSGLIESNKKWQEDWEKEFKERVALGSELTTLKEKLKVALEWQQKATKLLSQMDALITQIKQGDL